ncbi:hypothetical protein FHU13_005671 [Methylobacterium sp. R2-1]|nr:hypothetical protein [Methylobacterium sp. R2-1]
MKRARSFLMSKNNREILTWVGGGLAAIIAGLWAAYVHFTTPDKPLASGLSTTATCGSVAMGSASGSTITAGNTGNCSAGQKPEVKP